MSPTDSPAENVIQVDVTRLRSDEELLCALLAAAKFAVAERARITAELAPHACNPLAKYHARRHK
jgi:hypothetical protein